MKKLMLFTTVLMMVAAGTVFGQGLETFDNLTITGTSYQDGTFLGQDGSTWTFWQCRGDVEITGKAIMLGRNRTPQAEVFSGTISGGIGELNFNYMQAFGTNVNLNVEINGIVVGNVTSSGQQNVILNSGIIVVNVEGDFVIRFINANNGDGQVVIDDVEWTGYPGEPGPTATPTETPLPTETPEPTATPTPLPTAPPCEEEMAVNGDFENWVDNGPGGPPDHWSTTAGLSAEQTTDEVHTGTYSALITKLGTGTRRIDQVVNYQIIPSAEYSLSYWIIDNDDTAGNRSRAWIYFADEDGVFIENIFTGYSDEEEEPGWQELTGSGLAPPDAHFAQIRIAFYGDIGVEYYIDNVSLIQVCETTPTPGPTETPTPTPTEVPTLPCGEELLLNPDLEDWSINGPLGPPDHWQLHWMGNMSVVQTDTVVQSGNYAGVISKTVEGPNTTRYLEQIVPYQINPGSEYTLSYWVLDNHDDPGVSESRAWIGWYSQPGGEGPIFQSFTGFSSADPDGQNLTVTAEAPSNAVSARVRIAIYGDADLDFYIDNVSLIEVCPPTPTPGSPTPTPDPEPIPTTGPVGIGILLLAIGALIALTGLKRS